MTHLSIMAMREALDRIYSTYGISAENLANIHQSIAVALLNAYTDHQRLPKSHYFSWKSTEAELREFIGLVTGDRQDILLPETAANPTLFEAQP